LQLHPVIIAGTDGLCPYSKLLYQYNALIHKNLSVKIGNELNF
jgi:hypothetical protein